MQLPNKDDTSRHRKLLQHPHLGGTPPNWYGSGGLGAYFGQKVEGKETLFICCVADLPHLENRIQSLDLSEQKGLYENGKGLY